MDHKERDVAIDTRRTVGSIEDSETIMENVRGRTISCPEMECCRGPVDVCELARIEIFAACSAVVRGKRVFAKEGDRLGMVKERPTSLLVVNI